MKRCGTNLLVVLIASLMMALVGCSPTVQSSGKKSDTGVEQQDTGGSGSEDTWSGGDFDGSDETSDAEFDVDEDADWIGPGEDQDAEEWDVYQPTVTCASEGLTECFLNTDCEDPSDTCKIINEEMPTLCCVPGPRGTLGVGEECGGHGSEDENNAACASGMCLDNGERAICTQRCDDETGDCPAEASECVGIAGLGGVCVPPGFM